MLRDKTYSNLTLLNLRTKVTGEDSNLLSLIPNCSWNSFLVSAPFFSSMSVMQTLQPFCRSRRANCRPNPCAPPVMMARLPLTSNIFDLKKICRSNHRRPKIARPTSRNIVMLFPLSNLLCGGLNNQKFNDKNVQLWGRVLLID